MEFEAEGRMMVLLVMFNVAVMNTELSGGKYKGLM